MVIKYSKYLLLFIMAAIGSVALTNSTGYARGNQLADMNLIRQEAKEFVINQLEWDPDRVDVDINYTGKKAILPPGKVTWSFKLPGQKRRIGKVPFMAFIKVNDRVAKRIRLDAHITLTYELYRAVRPLKRGQVLQPHDIELATVKTDRKLRNIITRKDELIGHRLIHTLEAGEPVLNHMIRKIPLVKTGDRILLVAQKGALRVTAPGVVKENGFKNDMVKVENVQSRKIIYGTVVDARTILINF